MRPYKPDPGAGPICELCEKQDCINRYKFQRGNRRFSVASGRCPRLPDARGRYDPDWYDLRGRRYGQYITEETS